MGEVYAVLLDDQLNVIVSIKKHTILDVYDGIPCAVEAVLEQADINRSEIHQAM